CPGCPVPCGLRREPRKRLAGSTGRTALSVLQDAAAPATVHGGSVVRTCRTSQRHDAPFAVVTDEIQQLANRHARDAQLAGLSNHVIPGLLPCVGVSVCRVTHLRLVSNDQITRVPSDFPLNLSVLIFCVDRAIVDSY